MWLMEWTTLPIFCEERREGWRWGGNEEEEREGRGKRLNGMVGGGRARARARGGMRAAEDQRGGGRRVEGNEIKALFLQFVSYILVCAGTQCIVI